MELIPKILATILNTFSFLFCVTIAVIYWRKKQIHSFPLGLAILLCVSCGLAHLLIILQYFVNINIFQSFIFFFNVISCCLTCLISFTILYNYTYTNCIHQNKLKFTIIYIVSTSLISLTVLIIHVLYCEDMLNLIIPSLYLTIVWISTILNVIFVTIIALRIKNQYGLKTYRVKFIFYCLAPIVIYIPETLNLTYLKGTTLMPVALSYFILITNGIKGMIFTLVYGVNIDIAKGIRKTTSASSQDAQSLNKAFTEDPTLSFRYTDVYND